jgi:hypothetical protein
MLIAAPSACAGLWLRQKPVFPGVLADLFPQLIVKTFWHPVVLGYSSLKHVKAVTTERNLDSPRWHFKGGVMQVQAPTRILLFESDSRCKPSHVGLISDREPYFFTLLSDGLLDNSY